jgi:hypothetical protein
MLCSLTIIRYPKKFAFFGILSMALFRWPLWLNQKISFYKLMGCGKNGAFDIHPDWQQWCIMVVYKEDEKEHSKLIMADDITPLLPVFIKQYHSLFNCEVFSLLLQPIEGHGTWNNKTCFGQLPKQTEYEGLIGVLTRADIRYNKLKRFWSHVDAVALQMNTAKGFITSVGMGELPWIKGATFSIWKSKAAMKQFAYGMKTHADVVVKTKKENWYSEEMFVRFIPLKSWGSLHRKKPLTGIL